MRNPHDEKEREKKKKKMQKSYLQEIKSAVTTVGATVTREGATVMTIQEGTFQAGNGGTRSPQSNSAAHTYLILHQPLRRLQHRQYLSNLPLLILLWRFGVGRLPSGQAPVLAEHEKGDDEAGEGEEGVEDGGDAGNLGKSAHFEIYSTY